MELLPNAARLERALADGADREAWLAARRTGIGGSDIPKICGLSKWGTAQDVFRDKVGAATADRANWAMKQGNRMEPEIVETWAEGVGATVFAVPMLRDRDAPHRLANPDRVAVVDGIPGVVEVKWRLDGVPDDLPLPYYLQAMWYLQQTGLRRADVVVGAPFDEPRAFPVVFDEDIAAKMVADADRFWMENVLANVLPLPSTPDERLMAALDRVRGSVLVVDATDEAEAIAAELLKAKAAKDEAKGRVKALTVDLSEVLSVFGATKMKGAGWSASFVEREGNVDWPALCEEFGIPKGTQERFRKAGSGFLGFYPSRKKGGN